MSIARIAAAATVAIMLFAASAQARSHHHARHRTIPSVTVGSFDQGLGYGLHIMLQSMRQNPSPDQAGKFSR